MSRKHTLWYAVIGIGVVGYVCIRPLAALTREPQVATVAPTVIPAPLIGLGRIEAGDGLVLAAAEVDGTVANVLVQAGDAVAPGAVLVQLKDSQIREEAAALRAKMEVQQRRIATLDAARLSAIAHRDRTERTLTRLRAVAASGEVSEDQLDSAETAVRIARFDAQRREAEVEVGRAEVRAALRDIATADARVAQRALLVRPSG